MIKICKWPDGIWCKYEDLESHLQWLSDDFEIISLTEDEYEVFVGCN